MKSTLTYLLLCLLAHSATAQNWSFGPKTYLGLSRTLTGGDEAVLPIGSIGTAIYGDATISGLGVFARYDRPRWYAELDAIHGRSYAVNLDIRSANGSGPAYPRARRYDLRLLAGYKPLPWLRLSAGVVGVSNNWNNRDYSADINRLNALIRTEQAAASRERYQNEINSYQLSTAAGNALKTNLLEGQLGVGADIGGLTLDVTYNPGLLPGVDGVQFEGRSYAFQQRYAFWSLAVGYKLFPLKSHLLAPNKNKAYARLQRDIPFIRNEFSVGVGLLAEDLNSAFIYENRYTRYITPRFGLTATLAFQRGLAGYEAYDPNRYVYRNGGFAVRNTVSFLLGARALLLYTRHHRLGLNFGAQVSYADGISGNGGSRAVTVNGKAATISYVNLYADSRQNRVRVGPQVGLDYQFLPTDRIALGPWIRATDFGAFGVQAGYRF